MRKYFVLILLSFCYNLTLSQPKTNNMGPKPSIPPPKRITFPNCIHYEIFLRSFADSNGDGIGDFHGAVAKLNEVEQLGVQGIWLMPIHPSPSYHKYDVTDYYAIDKEYGTYKDFIYFLDEAHKRQIKVITDLVLNHCSSKHPWFVSAVKNPESEYRDYFLWNDSSKITFEPEHWYFPKDEKGKIIGKQKYYGYFSEEMPDWNYDNPKVREEMIKIGTYWLQQGVDGFRLDAAQHIYPEHEKNILWWQEFATAMRKIKPAVYLVGEVTNNSKTIAGYYSSNGLQSLFNFDLAEAVTYSLVKEKRADFFNEWVSNYNKMMSPKQQYTDAIFLSNHDQNRIMSEVKGDTQKAKLAASVLMTLPGAPFIYYGEEIGLEGMKPDPNLREPMLWDEKDDDSLRTHWIKPEYALEKNTVPLKKQKTDKNSIYRHYRKMINYRTHSKVLQFGSISASGIENENLLSFYRTFNKEKFLVVHNLSGKQQTIQLNAEDSLMIIPLIQNEKTTKIENGVLTIAPYATFVSKADNYNLIGRKKEEAAGVK